MSDVSPEGFSVGGVLAMAFLVPIAFIVMGGSAGSSSSRSSSDDSHRQTRNTRSEVIYDAPPTPRREVETRIKPEPTPPKLTRDDNSFSRTNFFQRVFGPGTNNSSYDYSTPWPRRNTESYKWRNSVADKAPATPKPRSAPIPGLHGRK